MCDRVDPEITVPAAEEATETENIATDGAEKVQELFECEICDFNSNWENGLKVHMSRIHSKIEQLDGNCDHHEDEKYGGSKQYWKKGWLGGAYQSFIDAYDVIEESDCPTRGFGSVMSIPVSIFRSSSGSLNS